MNKNILLIIIANLIFFLVIFFNKEDSSNQYIGTKAIEKNKPCVVGINVKKIKTKQIGLYSSFESNPDTIEINNLGSGVIISSDGYVITNAHVVEEAIDITFTLNGGKNYKGEIIGIDYLTDLALVKITSKNLNFPYAKLGNSNNLIAGEPVFALGNPLGLFDVSNQPTATSGIISGTNIDFGLKNQRYVYQDMIQTDAAINSGNSGGPLININGDVIGINTFIITASDYSTGSIGIGFSIPINRVKDIIGDIKQLGQINRYYSTGIEVEPINETTMKAFRLKNKNGALVIDVKKNSSGDKSGLKVGDVILKVQNENVNSARDIKKVIDEGFHRTGDIIKLIIWRNEKTKELDLELASPK